MHVVVVGGGISGLCAADALLARGCAVTVVERGGPDHDSCSIGNGGMLVPSHFEPLAAPGMIGLGLRYLLDPEGPFAIRPRLDAALLGWLYRFWRASTPAHVARCGPLLRDLHLRSRALFVDYAARLPGGFDLETKGLLMLCKTARTLDHEAAFAERARALGVPAEVLDAAQLARVEPTATLDVAGAVWFPKDAHLSPQGFVAALTERIAQHGGRFVWNAEAVGFRSDGRRLRAVQTPQGDIEGDAFVLAAGVFSTGVARALGLRLPMQAGKGYSMDLLRPAERPSVCSILTEARVFVTPMGQTVRVGGTMEVGGLSTRVNERRVNGIRKAFPRYYPAFQPSEFDGLPVWAGLRPCAPDGMPYLGRTRAFDNLVVATGHAMMGLSLGPVTGEVVADLVTGQPSPFDSPLLSPDRYA